jgi:segregation and condensation protein B
MVLSNLEQHIEALIFASEKSINLLEMAEVINSIYDNNFSENDLKLIIDSIQQKYQQKDLAIELVNINGGFQFLTKKSYHNTINHLQLQRLKKKLSQAALETLAIIAYKQPITKSEIEQIRGVNCDYTVQKLLERELIIITGKADSIGKPILYTTSEVFMDYFGINSAAELPQLKDIAPTTNEIGQRTE